MLYEITCDNCKGQWVSEEDDVIYCDPCVIAGVTKEVTV